VRDLLAEDHLIGEGVRQMGGKAVISNHMINNVNEYWSIRRFLNRHTRWGKMRCKIGGIKYLAELLSNPVFLSCLPIFLWKPSAATVSFALLVSLIKTIGDYCIGRRIGACGRRMHYLLIPIKDLIIGFIWFVPLFSNTVTWRGNKYRLGKHTLLRQHTPIFSEHAFLPLGKRALFSLSSKLVKIRS
jgi:ceramide glucosyltransferase